MVSPTNIAKKTAKVDTVKSRLETCQMLFAGNLSGLSVKQVAELKLSMPPTTTVMTVKNTLMRRAIADTKWEAAGEFSNYSNMWFFVNEDFKGTVNAYEQFVNGLKREDGIKGGVFEGERCDAKGIADIAALPSKKELIAQIARSIKLVPTKLGRGVKAVPSKLARAIKLSVADEESGDAPTAE